MFKMTELFKQISRRKLLIYALVLGAIIIYLLWSIYGSSPQQPKAGFVPAPPAVTTPKVPGPKLTVPLMIVPKAAVKRKYPDAHIDDPDDQVIDTADIGPAPDGATTITTMNTNTGTAHTEVKIKPAPWFALERQNYLGIGYEMHLNGDQKAKVYFKRDLLRIKDIHLQGETVLKVPLAGTAKTVGFVGGNIEYRF